MNPPLPPDPLRLHWEGERCFALAKPGGIPVFPPHADPAGDCVLSCLLDLCPEQAGHDWPFAFAGGIAHRLDIGTSGQLLVARTPEDLTWLRDLFQRGWLEKTYELVSLGEVPWAENRIERKIGHDPRRKGKMVVQRGATTPHRGRWLEAETRFERLGPHRWRAVMRSGVMHQIRVHAAFVGIPLAGDHRYGGGACPWPRPDGVGLLLHHLGVSAQGFEPTPLPPPAWWPPASARV